MKGARTRSTAKLQAQAAIDAASRDFAARTIDAPAWQRRVSDALAAAYLGEDDPIWQSGFDGDAGLWRDARAFILDVLREVVEPGGRLIAGPIADDQLPTTLGAFTAAGVRDPQVVSTTDRNGKTRYAVWASSG